MDIWNELPNKVVGADIVTTFRKYLDGLIDRKAVEGYEPNAE